MSSASSRGITLSGMLLAVSIASADEPAEPKPKTESGWQKLFRTQATGYKIVFRDEKSPPAKLLPEPVLFWSQPERGGDDGAVYLWTRSGRPIAIGTFFIWPEPGGAKNLVHELHSLVNEPFEAKWKERGWTPPAESVKYHVLSDADPPAATAELRLLQLKKLSRTFEAKSVSRKQQETELRLLPRAIYRYEIDKNEASDVIDGALFGFVQGTDLEIVLMLEAFHTPSGDAWRCAFARMSDLKLFVRREGKPLWEVGLATFDDASGAYYTGNVERHEKPPS